MTTPSAGSATFDWTALPPGLHQRRFGDEEVGFEAWIWQGQPGPALVVNGATHGDEYEGPTLLRHWVGSWQPDDLRGTVLFIPVLNEGAFAATARCHPVDGTDLARTFPGRVDGTVTERLAHLFDSAVLARATHYIDLHSGGHALALYPWVGYIGDDPNVAPIQRAMAACFDQFWCWSGPFLPGRSMSAAFARQIPAIYVECFGAGGVRKQDLAALDRGLRHLFNEIGCLDGPAPTLAPQPHYQSTEAEETHLQVHHPAPHAGTLEPKVDLGDRVDGGSQLGLIWPTHDGPPTPVWAETEGTVVLRRHPRSVQAGDSLFVVVPI